MRLRLLLASWLLGLLVVAPAWTEELPLIDDVEPQPLLAQAKRITETLSYLGEPLSPDRQKALEAAASGDPREAAKNVQKTLDALCLVGVHINPESRVKVTRGPAAAELHEQGWRVFLIKVHNEAGVTAALRVASPNAEATQKRSSGSPEPKPSILPADVPDRWADVALFDAQPLNKNLSGLAVEYRVLQVFSRDSGRREAKLQFDVGQGTQDLGFRNELAVLFDCKPAVGVKLDVLDDDGRPTTAQFVFRDRQGRIYPGRSRRTAPDLFFHDQVYRADGESIAMPAGEYDATYTRGPEYLVQQRRIVVPAGKEHRESFRLKRWVDIASRGWYSGDHHVHAAGCAHYEAPTQGITPADMMRHIVGEDLNIGCVLTWGPCWYHQKEFFDGTVHRLSTPQNVMRYDVEVSGFPSSHAGHVCLLRLQEDDYPGTTRIEQWPSWDLPVLKWGREQGGVVGFAHSGWGLAVPGDRLPSYDKPPFDGIGANEYIVDVTHDACDFISAVDTPIIWELSIWYHTLNCGYRCRISGETDFPCIYGDRVGLGRIYVGLDEEQRKKGLSFDDWVIGVKNGRSYCCDGLSHLLDFRVNGLGVGKPGASGRISELNVKAGEKLTVQVDAAALLEEKPRDDIRRKPLDQKPYWHIERARIGDSRRVPVELIVNGEATAKQEINADGGMQSLTFDYTPQRSCWIALRIFPSCHTNPVFVEVDGQPIRASRRSAQWCIDSVEQCWTKKSPLIREAERPAAREAYDAAKAAYERIRETSFDDTMKKK